MSDHLFPSFSPAWMKDCQDDDDPYLPAFHQVNGGDRAVDDKDDVSYTKGPSLLLGSGLNVFLESRDGTGDDNYQKQQANEWVAQDNRQDDDDDDDKKLPVAAPMDCNGNSDVDSVGECIEDTLLPDIDHDMDVWKDRTIYKTCPKTHSQYFVGEPNHHHVRFGRGDCHTKGAANVHFHELILAFQPYYKAFKDKLLVIQEVKRALQMADMRFVRKDGTVWWVVPGRVPKDFPNSTRRPQL